MCQAILFLPVALGSNCSMYIFFLLSILESVFRTKDL
jgi:hypothetical protein